MADDPLQVLREKQERLLREAQEVEKDLHDFERIAKKHGINIGITAPQQPVEATTATPWAPTPAPPTPPATPVAYRSKKAQIEGEACKYLRSKGQRAQSGEIAKALLERGVDLGKTPNKTLAAYLARSPAFDNVPAKGGYGVVRNEPNAESEGFSLTH